MGYHIINLSNGTLQHEYVEDYEELAYINFITDDSIIYQGESHWSPFKVSQSEKYKHLSKGWFRAGIQAQELFKEQAIKAGYILEELNQDQKSFVAYTKNSKNISIKRGDFLIRNFGNIEIDVKCRGFKQQRKYFDFKCEDVTKHLNMQKFTNTPILIAVYENSNNRPLEDKVYLFPIERLDNNLSIKTNYRQGIGDCFKVPISAATVGFDLIDRVFEETSGNKGKSYTIEEKQLKHPNAYNPWTEQEISVLKSMMEIGKSVKEMALELGRKNSAIRSRINKITDEG